MLNKNEKYCHLCVLRGRFFIEGNQLLYHLVAGTFVFWSCGLNGDKIKELFRLLMGNVVKAGGT